MNHTAIAIIASVIVIAAILAGAYEAFAALTTVFAPGRTLGMISAALMVAGGVACAGVVYAAFKWVQRHSDQGS